MAMGKLIVLLLASTSLLLACASGHCRKAKEPPGQIVAPEASIEAKPGTEVRKVEVFKYDGSLQCGMGKAITLEAMAKELVQVEIYEQKKKPDGLMHIQMCGAPTGMANVFKISEQDLAKAESFGFRKWSFD